jgi:hypothetical protein
MSIKVIDLNLTQLLLTCLVTCEREEIDFSGFAGSFSSYNFSSALNTTSSIPPSTRLSVSVLPPNILLPTPPYASTTQPSSITMEDKNDNIKHDKPIMATDEDKHNNLSDSTKSSI